MTGSLLIAAIILNAASGFPGLLLPRKSRAGQWIAAIAVALGCSAGLASSLLGLLAKRSFLINFPWQAAGGSLLGMDALSAFFLAPLFLIGGLGSIYGLGYWPQDKHPLNARRLQLFWGTLIAGITILLSAKHGMAFLFGWEFMALSAFFLVDTEDDKAETRRAAWIYLVATHIGTLTLFFMFTFWRHGTGSFYLYRLAPGSMGFAELNVLFALFFAGFGLKAGIMPLHFWLPGAHANAPSHVSAILSGIMLKMGIYGILRMLSLLPAFPASWGIVAILLGTASAVIGILLALGQKDIKKALAYSSIENIGIIVMGIGLAMVGKSLNRGALVALGLGGALLHTWNHTLFKAMLFLASGSILHATGTRKLDALGGLSKSMPFTAAAFFGGAIAISGLPPLNGFVSELFVYLGLLSPLATGTAGMALAVAAPALALVGALALACFVRLYSTVFSGIPRSAAAEGVHESPMTMVAPMMLLLAGCAFIGLFPGLVAPILDGVVDSWANAAGSLPSLGSLVPFSLLGTISAILLAALCALFLAIRSSVQSRATAGTWDCGYAAPSGRMQYSGSSIADSFMSVFSAVLRPRGSWPKLRGAFPPPSEMRTAVDDPILDRMILPLAREVDKRSAWFRRFQQGVMQNYILYIFITVTILLAAMLPLREILKALLALMRME